MTDRDEQLETQLRACPLRGLSDEARCRLLADLASVTMDNADPSAAPNGAVMDQTLRSETHTQRRTIWRTILTHGYAAACVAAVACVAAIVGTAIVAHRISGDADSSLSSHRPNPPVVTPGPSANGASVALKPGPSDAHFEGMSGRKSTKEQPFKEQVAEAEVIVVATFVDSAPAGSGRLAGAAETVMRFRVARVLKGKLDKKIISIQHPDAPVGAGVNEIAGKEWILLLTPEYMAGKRPYASLCTVELEPEVRATLSAKPGDR